MGRVASVLADRAVEAPAAIGTGWPGSPRHATTTAPGGNSNSRCRRACGPSDAPRNPCPLSSPSRAGRARHGADQVAWAARLRLPGLDSPSGTPPQPRTHRQTPARRLRWSLSRPPRRLNGRPRAPWQASRPRARIGRLCNTRPGTQGLRPSCGKPLPVEAAARLWALATSRRPAPRGIRGRTAAIAADRGSKWRSVPAGRALDRTFN